MSSASNPILGLQDVSFSHGSGRFIEGLDLALGEAEFVGLLGPNGSGKSTVLRLMSGILRPDRGTVRLWGKPLGSYRNRDRAKLVSYLPQMLDMNVPFSVFELVGMGLYPYDKVTGISMDEALGMVGLADKGDTPLTELSGGERRRAYIAMTLLQGAGILLLDEPLANLDVRYQKELIALLRELNAGRKISILMALHDINLAFRFRRLVLVKDGRVLGEGAPEEVLAEGLLKEAFDMDMRIVRAGGEAFVSYGGGME
jgi:iron complex transport system ATP-binding protein